MRFWHLICNEIENKIIKVVDILTPLLKFTNNQLEESSTYPDWVKRKINLKKKLLKKLKSESNQETKSRIKNLSMEIRTHFKNEKRSKVRQEIIPSNNKTLWEAVKIAKDFNIDDLPDQMTIQFR